jgi:tRNA modification GTPase
MENDTIAAISTPAGGGGIGIIKISGQKSVSIASSIFRTSRSGDPFQNKPKSHKLYHGHIIDPEKGKTLDEALVSVMLSPHSYTREDVVEINIHSGPVVLRAILDLVLSHGARLAYPGEFTKRAFLNGRIDLTQAEAVIDIINAKSRKALEISNAQAGGNLKHSVNTISKTLKVVQIKLEAVIDFPEDVETLDPAVESAVIENEVLAKLRKLIAGYDDCHVIREGVRIAIAGKPNVGKSSLMNRLLKTDRSIVTPVPGTTRDSIEENLVISGIPAIISDTAGLRDTTDPVESLGIDKTKEAIRRADIILFMTDAVSPFTDADHKIYENIRDKQTVLVVNKIDLLPEGELIIINEDLKGLPCAKISALHDIGVESLKEMIREISIGNTGYDSTAIVPNLRQKLALEKALEHGISIVSGLKSQTPYEMVSIDIAAAIDSLNEITGINIKEDILDQIFSRFCVGK